MSTSRRVPASLSLSVAMLLAGAVNCPMAGALPDALPTGIDGKLGNNLRRLLLDADAAHSDSHSVKVLIVLEDQHSPSKRLPATPGEVVERRAAVVNHLKQQAAFTQAPLRQWLQTHGIAHRSFWALNAVAAQVTVSELRQLLARSDVRYIVPDQPTRQALPNPEAVAKFDWQRPFAIEWGVQKIRAPEVWGMGYTGQGVVVAGQDTGYQWDHPALRDKYRGWNGVSADHNYSWHDAIHAADWPGASNVCGFDLMAPCDDHGHGTHTAGTMAGDDGGSNQVGVAPGARWIGCRNMETGNGRPSTYAECFEWFLAPTDLAGANPDPSRAPDVINNSWGCPPAEGCDTAAITAMQTLVANVRAAGIVVVASAGNSGSACSTVVDPPAIHAASFTVGSTTSTDAISGFSSRGPTAAGLLKPNVVAPGSGVRSSVSGGGYSTFSGTSMAGPHVAGTVALMISANPTLRGDPDTIESILESTAVPLTSSQGCGGYGPMDVPNAVYGYGRIDAYAAVLAARALLPDEVFLDSFEQIPD